MDRFTFALEKLAGELAGGGASVRLTERELELLHMAARISEENNGEAFSLHQEMDENWHALYAQEMPWPRELFADPEDVVAIEVITRIGLLPVDGRRQVHLPVNDALHGLLKVMS
jgi:hypothetical protein